MTPKFIRERRIEQAAAQPGVATKHRLEQLTKLRRIAFEMLREAGLKKDPYRQRKIRTICADLNAEILSVSASALEGAGKRAENEREIRARRTRA